MNNKRWSALASSLVVVVVVGIFLYQSFSHGADGGAVQSQPTPTPTVVVRPSPTVAAQTGDQPGKFDFYVLNLSWSPDYCAANSADDPQQCSIGKKLGFVLHGLWPQYNRGYPSDCSPVKLTAEVKAKFPNLYPNSSLYDHEWGKHGTCSGLAPEQYLSLSKQLKESIAIPASYRAPEKPVRVTTAQLKQDLVAANPTLSESSLAVYCSGSGRFLQEVYVCFSPNGKPTACSKEIHNKAASSCGNPDLLVRNVR